MKLAALLAWTCGIVTACASAATGAPAFMGAIAGAFVPVGMLLLIWSERESL